MLNVNYSGITGQVTLNEQTLELSSTTFGVFNVQANRVLVKLGEYTQEKIYARDETNNTIYFSGLATERPAEFVMGCEPLKDYTFNVSVCKPKRTIIVLPLSGDAEVYCPTIESYEIGCDYVHVDGVVGWLLRNVFGGLICSVVLIVLLWKRNHPFIRYGQVLWLYVIVLGGLVGHAAPFLKMGPMSNLACTVPTILQSIGSTLMFGSLIVKSWRIKKLWIEARKSMKRVTIRNGLLVKRFAALVVVNVIVISLWLMYSPPKPTQKPFVTSFGHVVQTKVCHNKNDVTSNLILIHKMLMLFYACTLAMDIRTAPSLMSESKWIFVATYNGALSLLITQAVDAVVPDVAVRFMFYSVFTFITFAGTVVLIVGTRVFVVLTYDIKDWGTWINHQLETDSRTAFKANSGARRRNTRSITPTRTVQISDLHGSRESALAQSRLPRALSKTIVT